MVEILAAGGGSARRSCRNVSTARPSAFDVNLDALVVVQHPPAKRVGARQPEHERTEADALHDAADRTEHAVLIGRLQVDDAAAALPPHLHDLAILHEHRHRLHATGQGAQPGPAPR